MDEAVTENVKFFKVKSTIGVVRKVNFFLVDRIKLLRNTYIWKDNDNYQHTDWYRFQEAVKQNQNESWQILYDCTLKEMEIENW